MPSIQFSLSIVSLCLSSLTTAAVTNTSFCVASFSTPPRTSNVCLASSVELRSRFISNPKMFHARPTNTTTSINYGPMTAPSPYAWSWLMKDCRSLKINTTAVNPTMAIRIGETAMIKSSSWGPSINGTCRNSAFATCEAVACGSSIFSIHHHS